MIKKLNQSKIELMVDPNQTVFDVKYQIYKKEGISYNHQTLTFNGSVPDDVKTLIFYKINNQSTFGLYQ